MIHQLGLHTVLFVCTGRSTADVLISPSQHLPSLAVGCL